MDVRLFSNLYHGMVQIEAERQLNLMDALCYPKISDKDRRRVHKRWYKVAFPENFEKKVLKTTDLELF